MRRYPKYESSLEILQRNELRREGFLKKHPHAHPLCIEGKQISTTWWGKAWNENLNQYCDYENRLARGKRYVRGGAIFDINISAGKIEGYVGGNGNKTYHVEILIDACKKENLLEVLKNCKEQVSTLQDVIAGNFPIALKELLTDKKNGLFPSPQAIHIHCTCPDYAHVCKHTAALLYGVSVKLDEDPSYLFLLRQIHMDEVIGHVLKDNVHQLLKGSTNRYKRTIEVENLDTLFQLSNEE